MAATSCAMSRGFCAQMMNGPSTAQEQLMGKPESSSSASDSLVAILASCSNMGQLQVPSRPVGGSLGDRGMVAGCGDKRGFYSPGGVSSAFVGSPGELLEAGDEDGAGMINGDCSAGGHMQVEKKRRLTFEQVRSLERNFELENKLEPERKMQLSKELGLQPRQVAVWFQNRRARWKTKQLERDYELLSAAYNRLKTEFEAIVQEKDRLNNEVQRLSGKTVEIMNACSDGAPDQLPASSLSESETTTTDQMTSGDCNVVQMHVMNSSQTTKTDDQISCVIMSDNQRQQHHHHQVVNNETRLSPRRPSTVDHDNLMPNGILISATQQSEPEQSTTYSADSNSSDILNTDSPRSSTIDSCPTTTGTGTTGSTGTTTTGTGTTAAAASGVLVMPTDQQAAATAVMSYPQLASSAQASSFHLVAVDDDSSSLLRHAHQQQNVDYDLQKRAGLPGPPVIIQQSSSIKLEDDDDDDGNSNCYVQDVDHSCIYFLSQLDDKTAATPWWDWS